MLLEGTLSPLQFRDKVSLKSTPEPRTFEKIYAEMQDINAVQDNSFKDTAELLERGVDYLDNIVERIVSDEYINTFQENDNAAHQSIEKSLDRLNQIHNVILSLI